MTVGFVLGMESAVEFGDGFQKFIFVKSIGSIWAVGWFGEESG